MHPDGTSVQTIDGFDLTWGTNHLGHFLLTELLTPLLKEAAKVGRERPRIINVSSVCHKMMALDLDRLEFDGTQPIENL